MDMLSQECGQIAHVLRNYVQGFLTLDKPEIITLDNISAKIQGHIRGLRGHLFMSQQLKPSILGLVKPSYFLKRILSEDFYQDEDLDQNAIKEIRFLLDSLMQKIEIMDFEVNQAIMASTQKYFRVPQIEDIPQLKESEESIKELKKFFDEIEVFEFVDRQIENVQYLRDTNPILKKILCLSSNLSHQCQDQVSEYVYSPIFQNNANQIIQFSGEIQNASRNILSELNRLQDNVNANQARDNLEMYMNNLQQLKSFIDDKEYIIPTNKENLCKDIEILEQLYSLSKKILDQQF